MRRLIAVFALITLVSATMRIVTPERLATMTRIQEAISRACGYLQKRLTPLLPMAN